MPKITLCYVTLNRLEELQKNIRQTSSYVDRTIVIDGASEDGTIEWLRSEECSKLHVDFKVSKQVRLSTGNHTPKERNQYLEIAGSDGWLLIMDTDEFLEEEACKNLQNIIKEATAHGADNIGFRAHDYYTYEDGQVYDHASNYWHHSMFLKAYPNMKYVGHTHSHIVRPGATNRHFKSNYEYLHIKDERRMWQSSTYLWWTTAQTASNVTGTPEWTKFHRLMNSCGYQDWHLFNKAMDAGNIPQEIKDWFIAHKDANNPEERSWFMHYFIFKHPEENVLQISNRDKSWDYLIKCREKRNGL